MLSIKDLTIGYTSSILKDINLGLKNSSMVFLIGSNGVGKTTFLKTLAGILLPIHGTISLVSSVAYLAQVPQIQKEITSLEYVLLACQHRHIFPSLTQEKKALEILHTMKIDPKIQLRHLSGGQIQKVQIAQAIFKESEILLLDEPLSNLDLKNQIETIHLLKTLVAQGKSLLITTHDLNLALRYGGEIWIISDQSIISVHPEEIDKIQNILGIPLYPYYCSDLNKNAWLNY